VNEQLVDDDGAALAPDDGRDGLRTVRETGEPTRE
jgi:hypothetical protein